MTHDATPAEPADTPVTGWSDGLSQDYCAALGRWFADRLGAREELRRLFYGKSKS